jgi:hypothetical protein
MGERGGREGKVWDEIGQVRLPLVGITMALKKKVTTYKHLY